MSKDTLYGYATFRSNQTSIEIARRHALKKLGTLSLRDLFLLGVGLYIGEGSKSRGHVRITNSNPRVISLAIRWLEESFGLRTENLSLAIHLYPDNNIEESLSFWSRTTGIPRAQFRKTQVGRREKKHKKRGMLRYGTAHLNIRGRGERKFGVLLFRTIIALIDETYRQVN